MAVRIRLKKLGRKHRPFFRVCAMDARTPRDGRVIEELGYYDPMIPETDARAVLNGERIQYWVGVGATPTEKVGVLIKKYGANGTHLDQQKAALEKLRIKPELPPQPKVSLKKKEEETPAEEAAPADAEASAEAPATEEAPAAEAPAAEAPAAEAPAEEKPAEEKPAEAAAEEKPAEAAAEEAPKEEGGDK